MNSTKHEKNPAVSFLSKKQFKTYSQLSNDSAVKRRYHDYLIAVGKPLHLRLTNYDIHRIDGVWPN